MDITMPVMDGYTAAVEIRRTIPSTKMKIVEKEAKASGMDLTMAKPIDPEELDRIISQIKKEMPK